MTCGSGQGQKTRLRRVEGDVCERGQGQKTRRQETTKTKRREEGCDKERSAEQKGTTEEMDVTYNMVLVSKAETGRAGRLKVCLKVCKLA